MPETSRNELITVIQEVESDVKQIKTLIQGNGGKGIFQRLDEVEMIANLAVREPDCLERIKGLEQRYDRRKKDVRWAVEVFIRFAPWVVVVMSLVDRYIGK
jgi:hypothetical protein